MRGDELLRGDDERGDAAFHISHATTVQHAVADLRIERIAGPGLARARRYHIGMPQQHQHRRAAAMRCPQIVDLAQAQVFAGEARGSQAPCKQCLAASILGSHRGACNQIAGQIQHIVHVVRPCVITRLIYASLEQHRGHASASPARAAQNAHFPECGRRSCR